MEIKYTINKSLGGTARFLNNAEYAMHFSSIFSDYEVRFRGMNLVNVDLEEEIITGSRILPREPGKLVGHDRYDIKIAISVDPDGEGGIKIPTPQQVFSVIKYVMEEETKYFKSI
jgi:hypothetical protein